MQTTPPLLHLDWPNQYRIVSSKYPPINFFEKLVPKDQMDEIFYLESLTNDRLREEVGDLSLVKPHDRVSGEGASVVMAAFTHIGKRSRFSNGSYGVYYAAKTLHSAVFETVFHRQQFLSYTKEEAGEIDMRVYIGKILKNLHDVREPSYRSLHDPNDYSPSQLFGGQLREQEAFGLVYNSVRDLGGECIAVFRPPAISIPKQSQHIVYVWNGTKITSVYEKSKVLFDFGSRSQL